MAAPHAVAQALGYAFQNDAYLHEALTPPSAGLPMDNQRLEYLGDALLHASVGILIFRAHPTWKEGWMSKLRGVLVSVPSLRDWAKDLGVVLVTGPRSPRKPTPMGAGKPLADAVEALLAAVHEDACAACGDGFDQVLSIVEARFCETIRTATPALWEMQDPKSTLQERAASLGFPAPVYKLVRQTGPEHQPVFMVRAVVGAQVAEAEAQSLKQAQAAAAAQLLRNLE